MIELRQYTNPEGRNGLRGCGKLTTNEGVGTFTIKGKDFSARITGINLTPFVAKAAGTAYLCQVDTIAYSAVTQLTTVTIYVQKLVHTAADNNVVSLTDVDISVFYEYFIDDEPEGLPTDQTTNDVTIQEY